MKEKNNLIGLYVSYYLARFNEEANARLRYGSHRDTLNHLGKILEIKPTTIKNWRNEFDPLIGDRSGWHQLPMSKSRRAIVNALAHLDESAVYELVKDILPKPNRSKYLEIKQLENIISECDVKSIRETFYFARGITGHAAEEFFISQFNSDYFSLEGKLKDFLNLRVGYDFLTDGDDYYVYLISNISYSPKIQILQNPAAQIEAKKYTYTTIQVSWTVSQKIISEAFR